MACPCREGSGDRCCSLTTGRSCHHHGQCDQATCGTSRCEPETQGATFHPALTLLSRWTTFQLIQKFWEPWGEILLWAPLSIQTEILHVKTPPKISVMFTGTNTHTGCDSPPVVAWKSLAQIPGGGQLSIVFGTLKDSLFWVFFCFASFEVTLQRE